MNICVMETKTKSAAGRKKLAKSEKMVAVTIWVKQKHASYATKECAKVKTECLSKP